MDRDRIIAVYPGTFDPVTNGHLDIITWGSKIFDQVIVGVASNIKKPPLFPLDERMTMVEEAVSEYPNVSVIGFDNLLVDFAHDHNATIILRGLRAVSDFEYEFQLAGMNKTLASNIETIFLPTSEQYMFISSSLVKEVARLDGDVTEFAPTHVVTKLKGKIYNGLW